MSQTEPSLGNSKKDKATLVSKMSVSKCPEYSNKPCVEERRGEERKMGPKIGSWQRLDREASLNPNKLNQQTKGQAWQPMPCNSIPGEGEAGESNSRPTWVTQ